MECPKFLFFVRLFACVLTNSTILVQQVKSARQCLQGQDCHGLGGAMGEQTSLLPASPRVGLQSRGWLCSWAQCLSEN